MGFIDYYKILNVNINDSLDTIKKNYRSLVKMYHPDSNIDKSAKEKEENAEKLKLIYDAYEVLSNDLKRVEYDEEYYEHLKEKTQKVEYSSSADTTNNVKNDFNSNTKTTSKRRTSKESFSKRHRNFAKNLDKEYDFGENIFFANAGKISLHICAEVLYQFDKLINSMAFKYVIENKLLLITTLACFVSIASATNNKEITSNILRTSMNEEVNHQNTINLTRFYRVESGDTLYELSQDTNVPIHKIKAINNKYTDDLYIGEQLILPYNISYNDLEYYTYIVPFDRTITLRDFAKIYDTNIDDLMALNEERIIESNGTYIVLSDYLNVPNFISKEELAAKKDSKSLQKK